MRLRIDLSYDGTDFSGWATQPGLRTVQSSVETALGQVLGLSDPPTTVCAGRTDAGVHARGQVVHVDLPSPTSTPWPDLDILSRRFSRRLPSDIVLRKLLEAPAGFDARFSALSRLYVYRLWDSDCYDPLTRKYSTCYSHPLNLSAMQHASQDLLGLHDFAAFCRAKPGGTTIRCLETLTVRRELSTMITFTVKGDAFCHSMVRSLVGALVAIGRDFRNREWLTHHLSSTTRAHDITVMPAHGLTLEKVYYPHDEELSDQANRTRTRRDEFP
ncbi:MAG: tRNA pseudouridine(38-40) synthase TruA [Propionibacteriaceae bacterium]|jgi:tRNA pseudouridine38-40 synthase|nr:tRNA pseudouridine(38-40) synthase TruA [Propionibacteriaceae bacterium]